MADRHLIKQYRGMVVLGLPKAPFRFLRCLRRGYGCELHVFHADCHRLALWRLVAKHHGCLPAPPELAVDALSRFAEHFPEKQLMLLAATDEARRFVMANQSSLERDFIIRDEGASYDTI